MQEHEIAECIGEDVLREYNIIGARWLFELMTDGIGTEPTTWFKARDKSQAYVMKHLLLKCAG